MKISGIRVSFLPPHNAVGEKVMFTFLIILNVPQRREWILRNPCVYRSNIALAMLIPTQECVWWTVRIAGHLEKYWSRLTKTHKHTPPLHCWTYIPTGCPKFGTFAKYFGNYDTERKGNKSAMGWSLERRCFKFFRKLPETPLFIKIKSLFLVSHYLFSGHSNYGLKVPNL